MPSPNISLWWRQVAAVRSRWSMAEPARGAPGAGRSFRPANSGTACGKRAPPTERGRLVRWSAQSRPGGSFDWRISSARTAVRPCGPSCSRARPSPPPASGRDGCPPCRSPRAKRGDIVMLGIGGFTPLAGFMGEADWRGVCDGMRTADGLFWPIPITLSVDADTAGGIGTGDEVALAGPGDPAPMAILEVSEKYTIDKAHECRSVFRTTDAGHPGVKMVMEQGEVNLAGRLDGALRRRFSGRVRRTVPDPGRDPGPVRSERLEHGRRVPDPQPDAPLSRIPGQDRNRDLRRGAHPLAAGQPEARRRPGFGASPRHRLPHRELLRREHRRARRLSARHALRRSPGGAAARAVPPELRLLPPARRARSRGSGRLLRAVRRPPHLRRDRCRGR